ncbi:unnamed protein product [Gordionus sp. m RMFG-2023]|uniref:protein FAM32A-like n=1 Tax=Gordionus sp. m RMFG-2023 TaxID=3053472 RepID=UPI0030DFB51D
MESQSTDDQDQFYQKGPIKFKTKSSKKKKNKDISKPINISKPENLAKVIITHNKTKAEKVFEERKLAKLTDWALDKAKKTHRQKVEEFNKYLDSLSEYYDVQKVSWTK